jgi:dihydroorotate dehydrogenase (NAD+) catalytic subunit
VTGLATGLATELAGRSLRSPVLTAAGCGGTGRELEPYGDLTAIGAFTTRTITLDSSPGAPGPRLVETPSGVLTGTGRQNSGLQGFLATELPWLAQRRVTTVVSVAGTTLGEYAELARRVAESPGVAGIELDLEGLNAWTVGKVVTAVRREVPRGVLVLAKLAPGAALTDLARAAGDSGTDAVVLVQGFPGLLFAPDTWRPRLGSVTGTVSGPAVLAQALRCVWDVHAAVPGLPLVGVGGVRTGFDAVQMMLAGATAVQVGTALLRDPAAAHRITAELAEQLATHQIERPADLVGAGHQEQT